MRAVRTWSVCQRHLISTPLLPPPTVAFTIWWVRLALGMLDLQVENVLCWAAQCLWYMAVEISSISQTSMTQLIIWAVCVECAEEGRGSIITNVQTRVLCVARDVRLYYGIDVEKDSVLKHQSTICQSCYRRLNKMQKINTPSETMLKNTNSGIEACNRVWAEYESTASKF